MILPDAKNLGPLPCKNSMT